MLILGLVIAALLILLALLFFFHVQNSTVRI
jgi:hypothetical protein